MEKKAEPRTSREITAAFSKGNLRQAANMLLDHYESRQTGGSDSHPVFGAQMLRMLGHEIMKHEKTRSRLASVSKFIGAEDRAHIYGQHFLRVSESIFPLEDHMLTDLLGDRSDVLMNEG